MHRPRTKTQSSPKSCRRNPYYGFPIQSKSRRLATDIDHQTEYSRNLSSLHDHSHCRSKYGKSTEATTETFNNKGVSTYRDLFAHTNSSLLPFLNSLRKHKKIAVAQYREGTAQPFQVSSKPTCNQKTRKAVSDFRTPSKRLQQSSLKWLKHSDINLKNCMEYECTLRSYQNLTGTVEHEDPFDYNNVRLDREKHEIQTIVPRVYERAQLVCHRFKKTLKPGQIKDT